MKKVKNLALVQGTNRSIGHEDLAEYFALIGEARRFPECLHNFQTGIFSGLCYFDEVDEDGEELRFYYAIGIVTDGDEGATVYVTRPNSTLKTLQLASYLFDDVRAVDLHWLSLLFSDMHELLCDIEELE